MKYLILVTDGAGDDPIEELDMMTPLEFAHIPNMNRLAEKGIVGRVSTIPEGCPPGSDAANLSLLGYDPVKYLTGRSPLEAASIGVNLEEGDMAYRANLVTLSGNSVEGARDINYQDLIVKDHAAGDISTEESDILISELNKIFANEKLRFYTGTSFRNCLVIKGGFGQEILTPPHDILERRAGDYWPKGPGSELIKEMMEESYKILRKHPINIKRIEAGLNPANSLWIWGQGTRPNLPSFKEKYGISGSVISAVDLIKGIAIFAGLTPINVEGATGTIHTNYRAKEEAAIRAYEAGDPFVFVHIEGPDECSHQGDLAGKIKCLEDIDKKFLEGILKYLEEQDEPYRILILPDHKTPLKKRTHSSDPVPFLIFDSKSSLLVSPEIALESKPKKEKETVHKGFNEKTGERGPFFDQGPKLANYFFEKARIKEEYKEEYKEE